jgi:hypothetical protein
MQTIKSVGVLSCAKTLGVVHGLLGLLLVPFFLLFSLAGFTSKASDMGSALAGIGMLAIAIIMPFVYAAFGFIFGALFSWIYNLVARLTGGIELELGAPGSA